MKELISVLKEIADILRRILMRLPKLQEIEQTREFIDSFGGYNHNLKIGDNEFYDMENMTSDNYPLVSVREKRNRLGNSIYQIVGMIDKNGLYKVVWQEDAEKTKLLKPNGSVVSSIPLQDNYNTRQLVSFGTYIIILPDWVWYNTTDDSYGSVLQGILAGSSTIPCTMCNIDGTDYTVNSTGANPPSNPSNNDIWMDTSGDKPSLKKYSSSTGTWVAITTTYIKIGFNDDFAKEGDAVKISGNEQGGSTGIEDIIKEKQYIYKAGTNYIVIQGFLETSTGLADFGMFRGVYALDYLIECDNRLWGCRYGTQDGKFVNEIYASKLGDFKNWYVFQGTSTDSYAVSLGGDGEFTGAINYKGIPTFFRENEIIKIIGKYPAQYQVQVTKCDGVESGAADSLAIVNNVLFYKSKKGIMAYDGSMPVEVSQALGSDTFVASECKAGVYNNKYYIAMRTQKDKTNNVKKWRFYVYDTEKGMWHKEVVPNNSSVSCICTSQSDNNLYFCKGIQVPNTAGFSYWTVSGTNEGTIPWFVESGILGTDNPDHKYISKLNIRMQLELNAKCIISIMYDSSGKWEEVANIKGTTLDSFTIPILPHRCDHFRYRIEGEGDCKIFSITKTLEQGSDVR